MLYDDVVCFYTDDTGQKTAGRYFVLAGIAIAHDRASIRNDLLQIETASLKRQMDWHGCDRKRRIDYLGSALDIKALRTRIFYQAKPNVPATSYWSQRIEALLAAARQFAPHSVRAIHHEGFTRSNRENLQYALRRHGKGYEVRSARFVRHAEVRLADSLAGMIAKVRFASDGDEYADLLKDWFVEI